jgi:hypothetical protein
LLTGEQSAEDLQLSSEAGLAGFLLPGARTEIPQQSTHRIVTAKVVAGRGIGQLEVRLANP